MATSTYDSGERTSPLVAMRRYKYLTILLALAGLLDGVLVAGLLKEHTTAETRLSVGSGSLVNYKVPGFALASQELAASYARYVGLEQSQGVLLKALGSDAGKVTTVQASPIPDSSVVRIEVTATSPSVAVAAADLVGTSLRDRVNATPTDTQSQSLLRQFRQISDETAQASAQQAQANGVLNQLIGSGAPAKKVAAARQVLATISSQLSTLQLRQTAIGNQYQSLVNPPDTANNLVVVSPAAVTGNDRRAKQERYGLGGLALGLVLALLLANYLTRRRERRAARLQDDELRRVTEPSRFSEDPVVPGRVS